MSQHRGRVTDRAPPGSQWCSLNRPRLVSLGPSIPCRRAHSPHAPQSANTPKSFSRTPSPSVPGPKGPLYPSTPVPVSVSGGPPRNHGTAQGSGRGVSVLHQERPSRRGGRDTLRPPTPSRDCLGEDGRTCDPGRTRPAPRPHRRRVFHTKASGDRSQEEGRRVFSGQSVVGE